MSELPCVVHFIAGPYLKSDWIYNIIKGHSRLRPTVYCFRKRNLNIFPFNPIRSFEKLEKRSPRILFSLYRDKPAIIHAHFGHAGYDILAFKLLTRTPLITAFYGLDINLPKISFLWKYRFKLLFKFGNCFLATGKYMKRSIVNIGCPPAKIKVVPLGINLSGIPFKPRTLKNGEDIKFFFSGRLAQKKGVPDIIEAFNLLLKMAPQRKLRLTISADINNNPDQQNEKKIVLNKIRKYRLAKNVTLQWGQRSYPDYIAQFYKHHIFVSPSVKADNGDDEGGYLMSLLEASASGMPVVSTLHCDIPDTIIDGKSGYLVPEHRPDLLAKKLNDLCSNPKSWIKIGRTGRKLVETKFNDKKQIKKLENIYESLIK